MVRISSIEIEFRVWQRSLDAATLSIRSIFDALEASDAVRNSIADQFPDIFGCNACGELDLIAEVADLFRLEQVFFSAGGADGGYWICCSPSDRYAELAAAVAEKRDLEVRESHGWPILSLGCRTPSVARAAGESIPGGEGNISISEQAA